MTAGTRRMWSRTSRRALAFTVALAGACATALVGTAPVAAAADIRSRQWYLDAMHAEEIWLKTTGEGITVAVIDTGVNSSTPSLKGRVLKGLDASDAKGDATDDYNGHGTTMAELIAGSGEGGGLKGLAPGAKILPLRISNTELQNKESVNAHDAEEAIRFAADSDARIINMSFASEFMTQQEIDAVKYAQSKGKLFFAGVGNDAKKGNKPQYPANYPEVVGVAATDRDGRVADYSQHGDFVDIAAPGSDIPGWCDSTFTRYCDGDGTSTATALASASAALIWSAHPDWTANQVLRVMFESAARPEGSKEGTLSNYLGHGIVRPNAHINRGLGKPGDPNLSPLTNKRTSGAAPAGSAAPSSPASSQAPKDKPASDAAAAGASKKTAGGGNGTGLILGGAAAVVVVLAGAAFVVVRRRRTA
ncbi:S8 family serine peptidase [Streptomyces sp. NPDC059017]|uniref:S8 family serine peptidase n=1 Tax=unclassified Streptomyces TaxID=2593676 RepID=UPI0036A45A1C